MKALKLIIQREYTATVKTKAFLITTILVPVVMIVMVFLPQYLAHLDNDNIKKIYVIDHTNVYFSQLSSTDKYEFVNVDNESSLPQRGEKDSELYGLLTIDASLDQRPAAATFFSEKQQPPRELIQYINNVLSNTVKKQKLNTYTASINIDEQIVESLQQILNSKEHISINTRQWSETGEDKETAGDLVSGVGRILTFVMFFFIMMNGSMVMQSVVEEKTNKIVEVIVSSAKPFDLMMGKIIAVAMTGFTQLALWFVLLVVGSFAATSVIGLNISPDNVADMMGGGMDVNSMAAMGIDMNDMNAELLSILNINWFKVLACFMIYFVGGYLVYASLFAMFGSAANDSQEASQFMMPVMVIMMLAFYVGFAASRNPEGSLAFWGSIIPFTSPIVMMVRVPLEVPIWEIVLSIALLFITAILCIMLSGKIYRVGILMTGKKVTFKEIFKWLKYK